MIRVGVIGCGAISHSHLRSYAASGRAQIVAVADPIQAVTKTRAQEYDAKAYTDYADLLEAEDLQAVSICTPPPSHREITEHAAAHGLHVLCEKPLAMGVEDGTAMVAAAKRANVLLLTAFCNRFYTPIVKAKEWIDAGKLGPLHHLRLRFAGVELMAGTWLADPAQGGGILWETAPHYVDLFRYLVGEMKSIYAKGGTLAQDICGTDTVAFLAESVDGVVGTLEGSWSSPHTEKRVEVFGERGAIVIDFLAGRSRFSLDHVTERVETDIGGHDRFYMEISHFLDCIQGKTAPIVSGEDGVEAMRLIEAARQSIETGLPVSVESQV
ncbi:MAG: Gfo/Idh/MocA family oxidoreductase [Chloroflexota bacterium]|nr:Gfo/Idh/MocA family oxidoreductase [Chloroflexota bacterium]MDE2840857.1 Gfo/Idh/MocA family oxidoreductase [Chloroflexota bacterium]MDE2930172.1 Gfo/Idh/MocA family oxidoreductase [Chloroflexota bacterium]